MTSSTNRSQKIAVEKVRAAAAGRWLDILAHIARIPTDHLDGRHHACPKCGGKDRFRAFNNFAASGGVYCNKCFSSRNGDGFAAVEWMLGVDFLTAVRLVGEYLGVISLAAGTNGKPAAEKIDPAKNLKFLEWNPLAVALWCRHKPPATVAALESCHARLAIYRKQWPVVALPVFGERGGDAPAIGWALLSQSGGTLPAYSKDISTGKISTQWKKCLLTRGSSPGWLGQVDQLAGATHIWKVEGISDLLALAAQPLPAGHVVLTNAMGCKEDPAKTPWLAASVAGKQVYVLHDCDEPGQQGATSVPRNDGTARPGWAPALAATAAACRNVRLPYPIVPDHGADLRDWLRAGGTVNTLLTIAESSPVTIAAAVGPQAIEAIDDPHRLARVNLAKMRANGRDIRFWRDEWYIWKGDRYRKITVQEFRAKLAQSIKEEFDRHNIEKQQSGGEEGEVKTTHKVTKTLVTNVMEATAGMVVVSSSVELMTWLPDRSRRNYISMKNGLVDVDALLANADDPVLPHSPDWFSATSLSYAFDINAVCPRWEAFLERNLELDPERIKLLQEWAGYLLLPDTGQQKFLILEGEGANGKSVFLAGVSAMLGAANVSNIPLEIFGDRFSRTETLGKLANVASDMGEIDKVAEGYLKSFTSGDPMYFDRKGISGISCCPTARLMIACNNLPHVNDRSTGVWRRMIPIPFRVQIPVGDRIANMDKPWWWEQSGELPGIFLWALRGLIRLRKQGHFTPSEISKSSLENYRNEVNTARAFLTDFVEEKHGEVVRSALLYKCYGEWCKENGLRPFGERQFGKEVQRKFPAAGKKRMRETDSFSGKAIRHYVYENIEIASAKIGNFSTEDGIYLREEHLDEKSEDHS